MSRDLSQNRNEISANRFIWSVLLGFEGCLVDFPIQFDQYTRDSNLKHLHFTKVRKIIHQKTKKSAKKTKKKVKKSKIFSHNFFLDGINVGKSNIGIRCKEASFRTYSIWSIREQIQSCFNKDSSLMNNPYTGCNMKYPKKLLKEAFLTRWHLYFLFEMPWNRRVWFSVLPISVKNTWSSLKFWAFQIKFPSRD